MRLTRGGPVVRMPNMNDYYVSLSTDSRKRAVVSADVERGCKSDLKCNLFASLGVTWRPASNVTLNLSPSYSGSETSNQYVTAADDARAAAFYGRRYMFADLDQRSRAPLALSSARPRTPTEPPRTGRRRTAGPPVLRGPAARVPESPGAYPSHLRH